MSTSPPTPAGLDAARRDAAERFARSLWRLGQGLRLYGDSHAATRQAATDAAAGIQPWPDARLELRATPTALMLGSEALSETHGIGDAARMLDRARVAAIDVSREATADDLVHLMRALVLPRARPHWGEEDARALDEATGGRVRAASVTYGALRSGASGDRAFAWSSLVEAVCNGPGEVSVDELAVALGQRLARGSSGGTGGLGGSGTGGGKGDGHGPGQGPGPGAGPSNGAAPLGSAGQTDPRTSATAFETGGPESRTPGGPGIADSAHETAAEARRLATMLAETVRSAAPADRQRTVTRVSAVIERLAPAARARLLAIDDRAAGESLNTLTELSDALDPGELLMALDAVQGPTTLVCNEAVRLFARIARSARGNTGLAGGLGQLLARVSKAADGAGGGCAGALRSFAEMLERSRTADFNPEQYQALLDRFSRGDTDAIAPATSDGIRARWTDPHQHCAVLVATMAASPETTIEETGPLLVRVLDAVDVFLGLGNLAALVAAARAAQRFTEGTPTPASAENCKQFLSALGAPEFIGRLIAAVGERSADAPHALELLRLLGPNVISRALCAAASAGSVRADLAALIAGCGPETENVLRAVADSGTGAGVWLRSGLLPSDHLLALARIVAEKPRHPASQDAFVALHSAASVWTRDQVARALDHEAERVRVLGVDRARSLTESDRIDLLRTALRGTLAGRVPLAVLGPVVQVLQEAGTAGVRVIVRTCSALLRRPTPRRMSTVQTILDAMYAPTRARVILGPMRRTWLLSRIVYGALLGRRA